MRNALQEAKINKGKMHSVTTNARDLAENGEGNVFYKMTNKRGFLGIFRGDSKTTYALSTLKTSGEFKFENVITHPYTQISRLPDEIKEKIGGRN
ncbi:hypothetical protein Q5384_23645 (plasmid) [Enterobacter ludwigii]|uniref:hypothetical protein n=1 Tax=Enterobacter ludwigii TaxID=299767 RepID=UPI002B4C0746|nr:hypothetical protein [Enterobacter ludwigii]WRM07057.1 hypothetical protein Q5384_23645 [Enterobacter ludwigii]